VLCLFGSVTVRFAFLVIFKCTMHVRPSPLQGYVYPVYMDANIKYHFTWTPAQPTMLDFMAMHLLPLKTTAHLHAPFVP
jgi:hypothetical protein